TTTFSPDVVEATRVTLAASPVATRPANRFQLDEEMDLGPEKRPRLSPKRAALAVLAAALGIGVAVFGHHWWTISRFVQTTDDAYVGGDVTVIAPKVAGFISQLAV